MQTETLYSYIVLVLYCNLLSFINFFFWSVFRPPALSEINSAIHPAITKSLAYQDNYFICFSKFFSVCFSCICNF